MQSVPRPVRRDISVLQPAPFSGIAAGVYRYSCMFCDAVFFSRSDLFRHKVRNHRIQYGGGDLQDPPFPRDTDPFAFSPHSRELNQIYSDNEIYILERHSLDGDIFITFNFPIEGKVTNEMLTTQMRQIYVSDATNSSYKLEICAGLILQNNRDETFRYFKPEANAYVLDVPLLIQDEETLEANIKYLHSLNMDDMIRHFRPATNYQVIYITQLTYHIWLMDFALGMRRKSRIELPSYLRMSRSVVTNFDYRGYENCCIFVALAQSRLSTGKKKNINFRDCKASVKVLIREWYIHCQANNIRGYPATTPAAFKGLSWRDIPEFEQAFQVRICIMEKGADGSAVTRYTSLAKHSKRLYLNVHEKHLSWVNDPDGYTTRHKCLHCFRLFKRNNVMRRHQVKCARMTRYVCPTSAYRYFQSVFDQMEELGVVVPRDKRCYTYFATFDLEAMLSPCNRVTKSGATTYYNRHIPISCAIASNCPPFDEGVCFVNQDPDELVELMFERFSAIRQQAVKDAHDKWGEYLTAVQDKMQIRLDELKTFFLENDSTPEPEPEPDNKKPTLRERFIKYCKQDPSYSLIASVYKRLKIYMERMILLTFHGQKYDLHLITSSIVKYFLTRERETNTAVSARRAQQRRVRLLQLSDIASLQTSCGLDLIRQERARRHDDDDDEFVDSDASESSYSRMSNSSYSSSCSNSERSDESDSNSLRSGESDADSCADSDSVSDADSRSSLEYDSEYEHEQLIGGYGNEGGQAVSGYEELEQSVNDILAVDMIDDMALDLPGRFSVLRRSGSYVSMSNNRFQTLDVCNWLSPGTSYKKFLIAYGARDRKSFFPFEALTKVSDLLLPIPAYPSRAWTSELKGGVDMLHADYLEWEKVGKKENKPPPSTGRQNYDQLMTTCREKGLETLQDLLQYYNLQDVAPFVQAVENMQAEYFAQGLDIWKVSVGTPGLARIKMMRMAQQSNVIFPLFDSDNMDLYFMFRRNSVGGPSIVHTRRYRCGTDYLRADGKYMCNGISGYDCTSMYLGVLKHQMPTSMYVRRYESDGYKPHYRRNYFKMIVWLNDVQRSTGEFVRSRATNGCETRVHNYFLDGLIVKPSGEQIALEFNGCWHHKHSAIKAGCPLDRGKQQKGVANDAYDKWEKKKDFLLRHGYRVVCKWECDFDEECKNRSELRREIDGLKPPFLKTNPKAVTQEQVLNAISQGGLYGFVLCDLYTPDQVRERLDVLPPIFANHSVSMEDIGSIMQSYARRENIKVENRRLLLSAYAARDILLSARLLQYYMKLGLVITKVSQIIEFTPKTPFTQFVEEVTRRRQEASLNPDRRIIGEIHKLIGNSAYGSTMLDKLKYTQVGYVDGVNRARMAVNDPRFKCMRVVSDQTYEVERGHRRIELNVPIYVATNILMEAKLTLVSYCYDFLLHFIKMEHFNITFLDTDSVYCGWHFESLEDSVMPEKKEEFRRRIYGFCGDERHPLAILPRRCCRIHFQKDEKWPLLWKAEMTGIKTVYALTSKTYVCVGGNQQLKISCKGANKARVSEQNPHQLFKQVFDTREPASATNKGFQNVKGQMFTYSSVRTSAFPWLYLKRQVITACGSYTQAIPNLTLNPVPIHHHCIQLDSPALDCDAIKPFIFGDYVFQTVRQAHCYTKYVYCTRHNIPPMEASITVLAKIMNTDTQTDLLEISKELGVCDKFAYEEFDIAYHIASALMSRYPEMYLTLYNVKHDYIVNATQKDGRLGTGSSPGLCRWEEGAYLRGANIYGKVLMTIRNEVKRQDIIAR